MNILWITNTIFPAPCLALGLPASVVGGWLYGLAGQLVAKGEVKLAVAVPPRQNRAEFFIDLERLPFEKILKKYMASPPPWRKASALARRLIRAGLRRIW